MSDDNKPGCGCCLLLLIMAGSLIALFVLYLGGGGKGNLIAPVFLWAGLWFALFLAWLVLKLLAGDGDAEAVQACRKGCGCLFIVVLGLASPVIAHAIQPDIWWLGPIAWGFLLFCFALLGSPAKR